MKGNLIFGIICMLLVILPSASAITVDAYWDNGSDTINVDEGDIAGYWLALTSNSGYLEFDIELFEIDDTFVRDVFHYENDISFYNEHHSFDTSGLDGNYYLRVIGTENGVWYDHAYLYLNVQGEPVDPENNAPVINHIANQDAQCETQFNYQVIAVDEDGDDLEYSDNTNLFNINQNGLISFVPSCNDVGNHYITITVEDGNDGSDIEDFILEITEDVEENNAPYVPSNPIPTNGATNVQRTNIFMHWDGGDADGDLVYYDLYFGTNDNNMQLIVSDLTQTSYYMPSADYDTDYYWQIVASDGEDSTNGPVWSFTTVSDNDFNTVPVIEDILYQEAECSLRFRYQVEAHDSDQGDILIFSDNTDLFNINPINGLIDFVPGCSDVGDYEIVITVHDNHGAHNNVMFQLEIFEEGEDDDEDDDNSNDSGDDEEFSFEEVVSYGDCIDDGDGDEYGLRSVTRALREFNLGFVVHSHTIEEVCYLGYDPEVFYPYDENSFGLILLIALIFLAITIPIAVYAYRKLS
jgi:hypothetical protein